MTTFVFDRNQPIQVMQQSIPGIASLSPSSFVFSGSTFRGPGTSMFLGFHLGANEKGRSSQRREHHAAVFASPQSMAFVGRMASMAVLAMTAFAILVE